MITFLLSLSLPHVPANLTCDQAFFLFKIAYGKQYNITEQETLAFSTFCARYEDLKKQLKKNCKTCSVTSVFDIPDSELLNPRMRFPTFKVKRGQGVNCNYMYCYAENPLKKLDVIPPSADHRELGLATRARNQGGCGSCWAFASAAGLETLVLHNKSNNPVAWQLSPSGLDVSVQFLLSNLKGFNDYCSGGDATVALWQLANEQKTIEKTSNVPYAPNYMNKGPITPKLPESDYFQPFQQFPIVDDTNQTTPIIGLYLDESKSFDADTIAEMKSFIARGFPVYASMYTRVGSAAFSSYNGQGILYATCNKFNADHQVIFTGYGTKNGKPVWIVKNSWGENWGNFGYFYIEIGKNAFCLEQYAFGLIPAGYNLESTEEFENLSGENAFPGLERGRNGLDWDGQKQ
ncbi:Cathepsin_L [Hexamita inflata]|uniref:Cathepsin_L n=1 Tax=Hexamita inflata TaxID=28002 RepID=A0ABP1HYY8_9EUKA